MSAECLVKIRDVSISGSTLHEFDLPMLNSDVSVRDVIAERVRYQVDLLNRMQKYRGHSLFEIDEKEKLLNVKVESKLDPDKQITKAFRSFKRNGFFIIIGDTQVLDLDERIEVHADTEVSFVKLLPLVGG